ncbi:MULTISPECIES: P-loop NTPase fold protein [Rhodococcus]|uniref:KAP family P-loop domain-containing protein n=1 Tax=Rhodococcus opacus RKJ300 = JCM 13270 TaxID=1165867 RepID=I0WRV1_RHOOP|nr:MULTISPECIES: P-loop NTPase fold protein [Rhodococcus]EID79117.1 KAP family P-loop domain-containing protein [Rhodococcus opacus RKJ300 = JCM 13270]QQZ18439.1 hypothetical protein GO592_40375 [Rhodococcus sp. 21391]
MLATGCDHGGVFVWDPSAGAEVGGSLSAHTGSVLWGAWAQVNGRPMLATGSDDAAVRLWDLSTRHTFYPLQGHPAPVLWGAWAQVDGRPVLATGSEGTVRLWDPTTRAQTGNPTRQTGKLLWGAWAQVDGRPVLATGSDDGSVRLWDPSTGTEVGDSMIVHPGPVLWGAWARVDGRPVLATGSDKDGEVRLWDSSTSTETLLRASATSQVLWGAWARVDDRPVLATGSDNADAVDLWEVYEEQSHGRPSYRSDEVSDQDRLDRIKEATALAELITSRSAKPPLAVGLFGDWGEGKSHFLGLLEDRVKVSAKGGDAFAHHNVRQVRFNAWHYAETDLWASLVAEIFSQLAKPQVGEDIDTVERQHSRLEADLIAKRKLPEQIAAEGARGKRLEQALARVEKSEIHQALEDLDPELTDEVYEAVTTHLAWFRMKGIQIGMLQRVLPWWFWVPAVAVVVGVAGGFWLALPLFRSLASGIGLVGFVTGIVAVHRAIDKVAVSIKKARKAVGDSTNKKVRQLKEMIAHSHARRAALLRQQQDLTAAGQLAGLVTDRVAEGGYRHTLGLMTQIREDFERMADLLTRAHLESTDQETDQEKDARDVADAAGDNLPRIDRIVLYVDDLDRCPPERVVGLFEAVHLLLAVRLFVVVVAVDPRWLLRSIAVHYQDLLTLPDPSQAMAEILEEGGPEVDPDDEGHWASTPAQYLEKIFQVVFTLPPLSTSGYTSMLDDLLGPGAVQSSITSAVQGLHREGRPIPPNFVEALNNADVDDVIVDDGDSAVDLPAARIVERIDPLAFTDDELTLIRLLGPPLITTPRSVKRLANSYGLLSAISRLQSGAVPEAASQTDADLARRPAMVFARRADWVPRSWSRTVDSSSPQGSKCPHIDLARISGRAHAEMQRAQMVECR